MLLPNFLEMNLPNTLQNRPSKDATGQERWKYSNEILLTLEVNLKSSLKRKELNAGTRAAPALERLCVQPQELSKEQKLNKRDEQIPKESIRDQGMGMGERRRELQMILHDTEGMIQTKNAVWKFTRTRKNCLLHVTSCMPRQRRQALFTWLMLTILIQEC